MAKAKVHSSAHHQHVFCALQHSIPSTKLALTQKCTAQISGARHLSSQLVVHQTRYGTGHGVQLTRRFNLAYASDGEAAA